MLRLDAVWTGFADRFGEQALELEEKRALDRLVFTMIDLLHRVEISAQELDPVVAEHHDELVFAASSAELEPGSNMPDLFHMAVTELPALVHAEVEHLASELGQLTIESGAIKTTDPVAYQLDLLRKEESERLRSETQRAQELSISPPAHGTLGQQQAQGLSGDIAPKTKATLCYVGAGLSLLAFAGADGATVAVSLVGLAHSVERGAQEQQQKTNCRSCGITVEAPALYCPMCKTDVDWSAASPP